MKSIYRSQQGKELILELYDSQLTRLGKPYNDFFVDTSFGRTHIIETGAMPGEPLLVFHGGNSLFGGSFGAGIAAKTMCVVPGRIKRSVLYVPSGIKNAPGINSMSMMAPMIMYWMTKKDFWLKKCMLPMAVTEDNITQDISA